MEPEGSLLLISYLGITLWSLENKKRVCFGHNILIQLLLFQAVI
jgi:hypothetical protein